MCNCMFNKAVVWFPTNVLFGYVNIDSTFDIMQCYSNDIQISDVRDLQDLWLSRV